MKKYLSFLILILFSNGLFATHNRAGEITYRQISEFTFEITVLTYTYSLSLADRDNLEVQWGDNTTSIAPRVEVVNLPDNYQRNKYVSEHTYPGPGTYEIIVEDPNRNQGVGNIPNSVQVVFALKTVLQINSILGFNNTPILLNPPIDKAAINQVFIHNPAAYDVDGDSLSYKLAVCLEAGGVEISDYSLPPYDTEFYVDPIIGDLVWNTPTMKGIYNVAILIEEWRFGVKIGTIIRDMQIEVVDFVNETPEIVPINDYCVVAGDLVKFTVSATDPDNDQVTLQAVGGPLIVADSPAQFSTSVLSTGPTYTGIFSWFTNCSHVRKQPYQVTFKAYDDNYAISLVDIVNVRITVISPGPTNLTTEPTNKSINLYWSPCVCSNASGYEIYRKILPSGFIPDSCETGVPAYTEYVKIGETEGINDTIFIDNNDGQGLNQGTEYCYMVNAFFEDGAKSLASEEVCDRLIRGIPIITNVSVEETDTQNGEIYLAWSKPTELDTLLIEGPFKYLIYRSEGFWGENLVLIDSLYLNGLNDTIYYDSGLNTKDNPYSYKVELYNDEPSNRFLIGAPQIASSLYLNIEGSDNALTLLYDHNAPWIDSIFVIERYNPVTSQFDSIGFSDTYEYIDDYLINGQEYTYKIKEIGTYQIDKIIHPLINYSQINSGEPIDTIPPCQPDLIVDSDCDDLVNLLSWSNPNDYCSDDAIAYNIYYTNTYEGEMDLIMFIDSATTTSAIVYFSDTMLTMAGCYAITAIDSFANESEIVNRVCVDNCSFYELPNVFTPNSDNINDLYIPVENRFVEKVDMKIYSRWGNLVFETEDPELNWDGTNIESKKKVTDGVYYYVCDVYTHRLTGLEHHTLIGYIHVFGGENRTISE